MNLLLGVVGFVWLVIAPGYGQNSNGTSVILEDGASLTRMGIVFDNPLLRMLGKVFIHTENLVGEAKAEIFEDLCDLHPCSPWSKWSACSAHEADSYGIQTRKRRCGVDSPFCIQPRVRDEEPTNEQATRICEGSCPANYTISNGFCFQLVNVKVYKSEADALCGKDKAFVVNINSKTKSDALHEFLDTNGITTETIWIDGERSGIYSPWTFQYESAPVWTNWYSGEPTDSGDQYCRVEENSPRRWFDRNCNGPYYYVCEYPRRRA